MKWGEQQRVLRDDPRPRERRASCASARSTATPSSTRPPTSTRFYRLKDGAAGAPGRPDHRRRGIPRIGGDRARRRPLSGARAAGPRRSSRSPPPPRLGALARHLTESDPRHFQPANVNYGLFEELPGALRARRPPRRLRRAGARDLAAWIAARGRAAHGRAGGPGRDESSGGPRPPAPVGRPSARTRCAALIHRFLEHLEATSATLSPDTVARLRGRPAALPRLPGPRLPGQGPGRGRARGGRRAGGALVPRPPPPRRGSARSSQGRALAAVRSLFRFACREGSWRPTRPRRCARRRRPKTLPRHLRPGEVEGVDRGAHRGRRAAGAARPRHPRAALRRGPAGLASWWGSTGAASTSRRGCCGCWARGARSAWCPSAGRRRRRCAPGWRSGRRSARREGGGRASEPVFLNHRAARLDRPRRAAGDRPLGGGQRRCRAASIPTPCATPSPPTCWRAAPTCAPSRSCSGHSSLVDHPEVHPPRGRAPARPSTAAPIRGRKGARLVPSPRPSPTRGEGAAARPARSSQLAPACKEGRRRARRIQRSGVARGGGAKLEARTPSRAPDVRRL